MVKQFSSISKETIGYSKEIALELGCDKISTIHILIANCFIEKEESIMNFLFSSQDDFNTFFSAQKKGEPKTLNKKVRIQLTEEAEEAIQLSVLEKKHMKSKKVEPFHIFLASCKVPNSQFASICASQEMLYERLLTFCTEKGHLKRCKKETFFSKVKKLLNFQQ